MELSENGKPFANYFLGACQHWGFIYSRTMKLEELKEWIKAHKYITNEQNEWDESGNHYEMRIYAGTDGKFFAIEFSNDHPYEKWDKTRGKYGGGFVRGEYSGPREVFKKIRTVEYYDYEK